MSPKRKRRPWTARDIEVLTREYPHRPTAEVAALLGRSTTTCYAQARVRGLHKTPEYLASPMSGRVNGKNRGTSGRFRPGQRPWNVGQRYTAGGRAVLTRFEKGQKPHNWVPIGSHRVNHEGYLDRKVREGNRGAMNWVAVHRLVWIEAHGPIPPGYHVHFRPGRKSTKLEEITPDALEIVTQRQSMQRNSLHNLPPEITEVIYIRAGLVRRINRMEKARDEQHEKQN
jgi:hypothetical protein